MNSIFIKNNYIFQNKNASVSVAPFYIPANF